MNDQPFEIDTAEVFTVHRTDGEKIAIALSVGTGEGLTAEGLPLCSLIEWDFLMADGTVTTVRLAIPADRVAGYRALVWEALTALMDSNANSPKEGSHEQRANPDA